MQEPEKRGCSEEGPRRDNVILWLEVVLSRRREGPLGRSDPQPSGPGGAHLKPQP